eukprot:COSAG04_NODE_1013_length_8768_cov_10.694544_5_plen_388_part_00
MPAVVRVGGWRHEVPVAAEPDEESEDPSAGGTAPDLSERHSGSPEPQVRTNSDDEEEEPRAGAQLWGSPSPAFETIQGISLRLGTASPELRPRTPEPSLSGGSGSEGEPDDAEEFTASENCVLAPLVANDTEDSEQLPLVGNAEATSEATAQQEEVVGNEMRRAESAALHTEWSSVGPQWAALATDDADEESAAGVGRGAVPGTSRRETMARAMPCSVRLQDKLYELREHKIRGFRLPEFLGLAGSLALPTSDTWLDWSVIIKWYDDGDVHWAKAGLRINLLSGVLSGLLLGSVLTSGSAPWARKGWQWWAAYPLGLLVGLLGLAPAMYAALVIYTNTKEPDSPHVVTRPRLLKLFVGLELLFEAVPEVILQCGCPIPQPAMSLCSG